MSCRCEDIHRCRRDIDTLSQAIALLDSLTEEDALISRQLTLLVEKSAESAANRNAGELTEGEIRLNDPVEQSRMDTLEDCQRERNQLERELSALEEEDEDFHRSEER